MTSSNLEFVRSICADWERGNARSSEWAHSEIEVVFADGPNPDEWNGLSGLAEGWRDVLGAWEQFHPYVDEYCELDDERVVALVRWRGRGKRSGVELERTGAKGAMVFTVSAGGIKRLVTYLDRDRALADLGLAQETDT